MYHLQKELGYCITGETNEEIIIILYGEESAGKSTFYEPVMSVLGVGGETPGYGHYMHFNTLKKTSGEGDAPREDLLRLRTSRVVCCSEINKGTEFNTALVKKIASGEAIVARLPYARHNVEYLPYFKIVLGTNYLPVIPFDDGGAYRRFRVHPFDSKFEGENVDLTLKKDFLTNPKARECILAWLVEGCLAWQRQGLSDVPREIIRANAAYRKEQSPIGDFLDDYCILDNESGKENPDSRLANMIDKFNAERQYYGGEPIQERAFSSYMKAMGFKASRTTEKGTRIPYRYFIGVRLKSNEEIKNDYGYYDLVDIQERIVFEMLERCAIKYGDLIPQTAKYPKKETFLRETKNESCKLSDLPDFSGFRYQNHLDIVKAVRDVLVAWRHENGANYQKENRDTFVARVATVIRVRNPHWAERDLVKEITLLAENDKEIQGLLAELTIV